MGKASNRPIWGIDLGGTKIEGAILASKSDPKVVSRIRIPTEREKGYDHIMDGVAHVIELLQKESGLTPQSLGIGTPGVSDPRTGYLKNSNTVVLNARPFKEDLQRKLNLKVEMTNDANCFALAETRMGVVATECPEAKVVLGVIMGTGVGGGLVMNGSIWNGLMGIGGEWGHNYLDSSGGECYCGKSGCVEKVISGPAIAEYYRSLTGEAKTLKEIYVLYKKGETAAIRSIDRLVDFFGLAMSNVINIIDPDAIVIGGGVGNIDELYTAGVGAIEKYVFNDRLETKILKPKLGDSAGVFGAAFLNNP